VSRLVQPRGLRDPDYWAIRYQDADGEVRTRVIGRMTRERANEERILFDAEQVRQRRKTRGEVAPTASVPHVCARVTLDHFLQDGHLRRLDLLPTDERREVRRVIGVIRRLLPGVTLDELNGPTTQRGWLETRKAEGARWNTRRLEVRVLNGLLHDAGAQGLLSAPVRPARNIGPKDRRPYRFLEQDEIASLRGHLERAAPSKPPLRRLRAAIEVGLHCGLRPGEITSRRWTDFDFERGRLRIDHVEEIGFRVKRDQVRQVPLPDELVDHLREYRAWCGPHGRWFLQRNLVGVTWQVALTAWEEGKQRIFTTAEVAEACAHLRRFSSSATPWPAFVAACLHKRGGLLINEGRARWRANPRWTPPAPVRQETFNNALRRAAEAVGIEHVWPHALRHSWASLALAEGVPLHIVQAIGGWETPQVLLEVYAHVHPDRALAAVKDFRLLPDQEDER
jgi:integrase